MSKKEDRLRAQRVREEQDTQDASQRPVETVAGSSPNRRSWASHCAGWRVGVHERSKASREAGIYKCMWCAQTFDPPTEDEIELNQRRALTAPRAQTRPGGWHY